MARDDKAIGILLLLSGCTKFVSLSIGPTVPATFQKLGLSAAFLSGTAMSVKFWNSILDRRGEEQEKKLEKRLREAWDGMMLAEDMMRKEEGKLPLFHIDMPSGQRYRLEYLNERVWN